MPCPGTFHSTMMITTIAFRFRKQAIKYPKKSLLLALFPINAVSFSCEGEMVTESEMVARRAFFDRRNAYFATCPEWDEMAVFSGNRRSLSQHHSQIIKQTPSEMADSLAQTLEKAEKVSVFIFLIISTEWKFPFFIE